MQWLRDRVERWIARGSTSRTARSPRRARTPTCRCSPARRWSTSPRTTPCAWPTPTPASGCWPTAWPPCRCTPTAAPPPGVSRRRRTPASPQLLSRPAPGSTIADLMSLVMVHLNVHGEAFIAKYRSRRDDRAARPDRPDHRRRRAARPADRLPAARARRGGRPERHPAHQGDVLRRPARPLAGHRLPAGPPPVQLAPDQRGGAERQRRPPERHPHRPVAGQRLPSIEEVRERWDARHGGPPPPAGSPSSQGDVGFTPCQLQRRDSQFLQQRELSAREVARIFRVPAWLIDAPTGDSLTYSNVLEQNGRSSRTRCARGWSGWSARSAATRTCAPAARTSSSTWTACSGRTPASAPRSTPRR
jgi:hypothetical protein